MSTRANAAVRWLARAAADLLPDRDRIGDVPQHGAVLLLPNHPNARSTCLVVWASAERDVRFSPSRRSSARHSASPRRCRRHSVYRKRDAGVDTSKNAETFEARLGRPRGRRRDLYIS